MLKTALPLEPGSLPLYRYPMTGTTILPSTSIEPIKLKDALEERYLAYALSTIMHRALPDVRDV